MSTKRTIGVATDTNSGITMAQAEELGIRLVPMPFFINDEEFFEGVTIDRETFFSRLAAGDDVKTSQPSPTTLMDLWDDMLKEYTDVIYIPMSSGLSSSLMTAQMLAQDYDDKVHVIDNHRISVTQKQSVLDALAMVDKGMSADEICAVLDRTALEPSIYIAVDTLEYLKKGGRITPAGAAAASILHIKPVLQIQGDKLDAYAKVRGKKAAEEKMLQAIVHDMETRHPGKKCLIKGAHTCSAEEAEAWRQKVQEHFPDHVVSVDPLALSISCHIGESATAVVCMPIVEEAGETNFEL